MFRGKVRSLFALNQKYAKIGQSRALPCTGNSDLFDLILGLSQAGGIQQGHGQPAKIHTNLDHVARSPCKFRSDRRIAPCQSVKQR